MRLLHSSDLHIGADGEGGFTRRWGRGIGDVVRQERVDTVLLAGDTYDSNRVPAEAIEQSVQWFESLDVPVVILPGNHDCYDERSVYLSPSFGRSGRIEVLCEAAGSSVSLFDGELQIWGRAHPDHGAAMRPLEGAPVERTARWQIAMAHGHLVRSQHDRRRSYQIETSEIDGGEHDYVALGHWDRYFQVDSQTPAYYSGSPSHTGHALLVELGDGVEVRRVPL
ncbi:MAG: metallophosphoesterase [Dehalococcoidia bacterium]|nr:metallophosphoesterase [Dehalococcoidia bacterium]